MTGSICDLKRTSTRVFISSCLFMIVLGCLFRFWQIHQNQFLFYDEGMYLNHNRQFGELIKNQRRFSSRQEVLKAISIFLRSSFGSGKPFWQILLDIRLFFGLIDQWFWARVIAAVCGVITIFLTGAFSYRFFKNRWSGWLSAAVLAVLPSHVFYSRTALQESLATLCVLSGFYFYIFSRRFSWKVFLSGVLFGLAFFSNYRLLILPVIIGAAEAWMSFAEKRFFDIRKYVWCVVTFLMMAIGVGGAAFGGANSYFVFSWVLHQRNLAHQASFLWLNFLTYPYGLFRLEHMMFGLFFLVSPIVLFKVNRRFLFPFIAVLIQMMIFSVAYEKGARYICVMLPFIAMTVGAGAVFAVESLRSRWRKRLVIGLAVLMCLAIAIKSVQIVTDIRPDYEPAVQFLMEQDPQAKWISTQKLIQDLYVPDPKRVAELPVSFEGLLALYSQGYRYLVIDPQVYVSFTADEERFSMTLLGPYEFIRKHFEPLKVYDHFHRIAMERHVMEYSTDIVDSITFLRLNEEHGYGKLYLYDLNRIIPVMLRIVAQYRQGSLKTQRAGGQP